MSFICYVGSIKSAIKLYCMDAIQSSELKLHVRLRPMKALHGHTWNLGLRPCKRGSQTLLMPESSTRKDLEPFGVRMAVTTISGLGLQKLGPHINRAQ